MSNTRGNQNFIAVPSFIAPPGSQPWLAFKPATGGPCQIAFGGVETSAYIGAFDPNYKLDASIGAPVTRTSSGGAPTPSGSNGYSIGAFELDDGSCL